MFNSISHRSQRLLVAAAAAAVALFTGGLTGTAAHAAPVTLTSTVAGSGYNGGTQASMPLTADNSFVKQSTPWTYDAGLVDALDAIETISVSLVLGSADSAAAGNTNFDEFTLALDGIDTGLKLNGAWEVITNPGQDDIRPPLTFTFTPLNTDAILAALKDDGELVGTILDSEPGDDFLTLGSSEGGFGPTTLVINGIATGEPGGGSGSGDGGDGGGTVIPLPAGVWGRHRHDEQSRRGRRCQAPEEEELTRDVRDGSWVPPRLNNASGRALPVRPLALFLRGSRGLIAGRWNPSNTEPAGTRSATLRASKAPASRGDRTRVSPAACARRRSLPSFHASTRCGGRRG
jgi:hypothetical protein